MSLRSVGATFSPNTVKVIRLVRRGCTNRPFFHIGVAEQNVHKDEPLIEQLGTYDPYPNKFNEKLVSFNFKRVNYWLKEGAKVSAPVGKLLGLSGYFPIHHYSFQDAWNNRKMIKDHLTKLQEAVAEIQSQNQNSSLHEPTESTCTVSDESLETSLQPEKNEAVDDKPS